jgi:D-aminopeptidase
MFQRVAAPGRAADLPPRITVHPPRHPSAVRTLLLPALALAGVLSSHASHAQARPRAREAGVAVGILPPGPLNAITDVAGVRVGQVTRHEGDSIHTGVTAILPIDGNVFRERVPAAVHVGNAFGKLVGSTQVKELGELETPIVLTCTLCVWKAADALAAWMLAQPGMADVRSINPVVGETNDGGLNDIRARPVRPEDVTRALDSASTGPVEEGSVGAGSGTVAFGWKGGIGTSSRRLPAALGGWTVGVLVQTNFGGTLTINGAPVGRELGRYLFQQELAPPRVGLADRGDGSIMIVLATDAPLDARNLDRLGERALTGLARTGSGMTNGSGDYVIAFSTNPQVRRRGGTQPATVADLPNDAMSPLFQAAAEATEEAIYNSLFKATTVHGRGLTAEALPIDRTLEILRRYNALNQDRTLPPGRP